MTARRSRKCGFTLVELLVVITIIGILISMLLPAVQSAREAARRTSCSNNMKQIGLALHNHHTTYEQFPAGSVITGGDGCTSTGRGAPWTVMVLPFMELNNLYDQCDINAEFVSSNAESPTTGGNRDAWKTSVKAFQCPSFGASSSLNNHSNYYGVMGGGPDSDKKCHSSDPGRAFYDNGVLYQNSATRFADITDGSSNTFIVGEQRYQLLEGGRPDTHYLGWASSIRGGANSVTGVLAAAQLQINICDCDGSSHDTAFGSSGTIPPQGQGLHQRTFGSYHPGGCHFLAADGSNHFISDSVALTVYQQLCIRNVGQWVSIP